MSEAQSFKQFDLNPELQQAIADLGYETPTPVQAESIPLLIEGHDVLAEAQTGTGKTAAFALPILNKIDASCMKPQAIIITPTRELAIQVAEAFKSYAKHLEKFKITPIYGGQDYQIQLRALKRGSHVIVGTPGRVMDHMRRGTLDLTHLKTVVLDEADEMLNMGFIDDIETILGEISHPHQTALFSATIAPAIHKIAKRYLKDAKKIQIKQKKNTKDNIEQCFIRVDNKKKLDALTRLLETQELQAAIVFVRTKNSASELAEKLQARGYAAAALHGDMNQSMRETVISRIKKGSLDMIVATDVAARGIDVDRVTHVFNYDMPYDLESYTHRIGRTGRAGREGKAILFVGPRERRLLKDIEQSTKKPMQEILPPSLKDMAKRRSLQLNETVLQFIAHDKKIKPYQDMIKDMIEQSDHGAEEVAAVLAYLLQKTNPLPASEWTPVKEESYSDRGNNRRRNPRQSNSGGYSKGRKPSNGHSKSAAEGKSHKRSSLKLAKSGAKSSARSGAKSGAKRKNRRPNHA